MNDSNIIFNGVTVKHGNYTALDNIDLNIEKDSFVVIVGPNGGGKTTLLKVLLGLIKPNSGKVLIGDKSIENIPAESIGYVPQIKTLDRTFPALSIELAATGIKRNWISRLNNEEKKSVMEALERVGIAHLAQRQLSRLSGGELQRVYLARSFIRKPKILLLDEPAAGIDLPGENDIHKIIEEYRKESNALIIMVTHDWEAAYHHADKVLLINRMKICYDNPETAFSETFLRKTFSHIGHEHKMIFGHGNDFDSNNDYINDRGVHNHD